VVTDGTDRLSDGAKIRIAQARPANAGSAPATPSSTGATHGNGRRRHGADQNAGSASAS
jgi:multidrug efflux system membrane fusion protein